jgi:hypothetical protein
MTVHSHSTFAVTSRVVSCVKTLMVVVYTLADRNQIRILSEWLMWLIMASERGRNTSHVAHACDLRSMMTPRASRRYPGATTTTTTTTTTNSTNVFSHLGGSVGLQTANRSQAVGNRTSVTMMAKAIVHSGSERCRCQTNTENLHRARLKH